MLVWYRVLGNVHIFVSNTPLCKLPKSLCQMKKILLCSFVFGTFVSCSQTTNDRAASAQQVETKAPNSAYKPAFEGQTRINAVKTKTPYEFKVLTEDLSFPWGIKSLPDGRLIVTEKEAGHLRIVKLNGELSKPITGLPVVNNDGQGGLLGIAIDPAFEQNRMVYWVFAEKIDVGTLTSVAKGKLSSDETKVEGVTVIYRATPGHKGNLHYGGRIEFDKKGNLFVSTGERSDMVTRPQAQQLNSSLGKIIRITTDGQAVTGNPFEGQSGAKPELYSYGHRNVQGLAFHPVSGELFSNEFGPRGGDEVNFVRAGKNYGWPIITYGIEYSGKKVGEPIQQKEGMEQPVYYWDP
jgi:glucose/arabinose dehydrogenase